VNGKVVIGSLAHWLLSIAKEIIMSVKHQLSQVIDRPVADVFRFFAIEHVRNHPRWDPYLQLEQVTNGPIGGGTIIKRINTRSGTPVEGTMEIVEFEPNQSMGTITHDGPFEIRGRALFEADAHNRTTLTFDLEFPGLDETADMSMMVNSIQGSLNKIKQLIESET
jgi:hypothetical protein